MSIFANPYLERAVESGRAYRPDQFPDLFAPATVVLFAGLGGACKGIEESYVDGGFRDKFVDVSVNHWDIAVRVHELNHPLTQHLHADVWEVDPMSVLPGRKIAYLHASPDCTDFSKAKGGMPKRKHIRALADVVLVWAELRGPDVITLENVEEFKQWGPLMHKRHSRTKWVWIKRPVGKDKPAVSIFGPKMGSPETDAWIERHERAGSSVEPHLMPDPAKRGVEFDRWKKHLEGLGYVVESKELRACDYGAPTTRKRLFVIARCDGKPIIWPEKTHGPESKARSEQVSRSSIRDKDAARVSAVRGHLHPSRPDARGVSETDFQSVSDSIDSVSISARRGSKARQHFGGRQLKPFRATAECIDWHEPMLSIFATRAEARRWKNEINKTRDKHNRVGTPQRPLKLKTNQRLAGGTLKWVLDAAKPFILNIENYGWNSCQTRAVDEPLSTVTSGPRGGKHAIVDVQTAAFTGVFNHGGHNFRTNDPREPIGTITGARDARGAVGVELSAFTYPRYGEREGQSPRSGSVEVPMPTVTPGGNGANLVSVVLDKHYGGVFGRPIDGPADTITAKDHHGITVAHLTTYHGKKGDEARGQHPDQPITTIDTQNRYGLVAAHLSRMYGTNRGSNGDPENPLGSIGAQGLHSAVQVVYLSTYYGNSKEGCAVGALAPTVTSKDRISLCALETTPHWIFTKKGLTRARQVARWAIKHLKKKVQKHLLWVADEAGKKFPLLMLALNDALHIVTDIAMRMLRPRELARAQGFADDYVIDRTVDGQRLSNADQVKLIGNSVCPPVMRAIAWANVVSQGVVGPARRRRAVPA